MSTFTNRPWQSTIENQFARSLNQIWAMPNNEKQIHKLARNLIASLDLGCPNLKLVNNVSNGVVTDNMNPREKYYEWVRVWRIFYKELSQYIRHCKSLRRKTAFVQYFNDNIEKWKKLEASYKDHAGAKSFDESPLHSVKFDELKETAQILLNARYNAKLAYKQMMLKLNSK